MVGYMSRFALRSVFILALTSLGAGTWATARADETPRELHLIVQKDKLIASNVRLSRFDEFQLRPKERIQDKAVGSAVAVVYTNKRIIGYSVIRASWVSVRTEVGEKLRTIEAEDFSALVTTSERYLNFNGRSGIWAQRDLGVRDK